MIQHYPIQLPGFQQGFHLITPLILETIPSLPASGLLHVFIQHTSAGLTINENADPSVRFDFQQVFHRLIPENARYYTHTFEGPDDLPAHIKTALVGTSVSIPIISHRLQLGTWQGIYLCEFRKHSPPRNLLCTMYT
ncbi:MAG: secondary thiamine-phosphate synthase enzyme YjbQ [Bacteroidota bacterium]